MKDSRNIYLEDTISDIQFSARSDLSGLLLVSSWDKTVRLYDTKNNAILRSYEHKAAVLSCDFDREWCFSGGLDGEVIACDLQTGTKMVVGTHKESIRCIQRYPIGSASIVISGGWDKKLNIWDVRTKQTIQVDLPDKLFAMDISQNGQYLVAACANRHVYIYDARKNMSLQQKRLSNLQHQSRNVKCSSQGDKFALASTQGRVSINFFNPEIHSSKKYAFKCHKERIQEKDALYVVNSLAFHPIFNNLFATAGTDGKVKFWDAETKKKIQKQFTYERGISAISFNHDASLIAIAESDTWELGETDYPHQIHIENINIH